LKHSTVAVIDLGSNSSRVVVFRVGAGGVLDVLADEHVSLQLIRGLDRNRRLRDDVLERTLGLLRDFRHLAEAGGATRIHAFGTAALREATNREELLRRARSESGIRLEILDGAGEGRAGFLGAVYGLPVQDGLVFDIGGGSLQLTHFRDRRLQRTCSLPLGALRVTDEFLLSDPPLPGQVKKLRSHVLKLLAAAKLKKLPEGCVVVGTGGTVRNLAKVDARRWDYPIPRLHGYSLKYGRLREWTALLLGRDSAARAALPGLNRSRADSIVAGCLVAECVLEAAGASHFLVAGQGMREGSVLAATGGRLPTPEKVRTSAVAAFASRFATCDPVRAARRGRAALSLYDQLEPYPEPTWREMLGHASHLFDAGRSIDYYRVHTHSAFMVRSSGLAGFSHRGIALVSSMIEMADREGWDPHRCSPPLGENDYDALERAGLVLGLADAIEQRRKPGPPAAVRGLSTGRAFVLRDAGLADWSDPEFAKRFREAFGKDLQVRGPS
jgi:exopolyphosphatase/guanosine-5'-triphosphate,3'-diphosphate pyrophosphatase